VFVGGDRLEADDAVWTSFEIGHDGTWVVRTREYRGGAQGAVIVDVAGPETGPVVLPTAEDPTGKNVLAVEAGAEGVRFLLNGETVVTLPRTGLSLDGVAGFRVGTGLNVHLTTLDLTSDSGTTHWAPAKESGETGGGDS
jgi:hypothetical protein